MPRPRAPRGIVAAEGRNSGALRAPSCPRTRRVAKRTIPGEALGSGSEGAWKTAAVGLYGGSDGVPAMNEVSAEHPRDYTTYPTNRVVGIVGDAENAQAAIDALLQAGFDRKDIDILHGEEDLERLDPAAAKQGF